MVILTTCPNCAAPLEHNAPRCGSCKTRYCGRDCQKLHWKAHHRHWCERIKRGGGDERGGDAAAWDMWRSPGILESSVDALRRLRRSLDGP